MVGGFRPTTSGLWQGISNLSVTACNKSWSVVRLNRVSHFLQVQWIRDDFSLIRLNFSPQLQQTNFFCINMMEDWVVAFCFLIEVIADPISLLMIGGKSPALQYRSSSSILAIIFLFQCSAFSRKRIPVPSA